MLALPAAWGERSIKRLAIALLVSGLGVILPLFVFFFSAFLVPDWKGGCDHGWIDCFYLGKLALTPLVLWATGALYVLENRIVSSAHRFVVLGLLTGAMVASVCFVFGLVTVGIHLDWMACWLLVPCYVAAWHAIRVVHLIKASNFGWQSYLLTILGSVPFWIGGVIWSRWIYESLPNTSPDCFVVTAASRGHCKFVGPFVEITRHGRRLRANQQLITLWRFEALWQARAPRSHAVFRRAYGRIGPVIAAQIKFPWLADATYLALKPVEITARLINHNATESRELQQLD